MWWTTPLKVTDIVGAGWRRRGWRRGGDDDEGEGEDEGNWPSEPGGSPALPPPSPPPSPSPSSSLSSHPACLTSAGVSTPFQSGSCPWQNRQLVSSGVPAECSCHRARQAACTGRGQAHGSTSLSSLSSQPPPLPPLLPSPLRAPSPRQTQQASPELEVFFEAVVVALSQKVSEVEG